MVHGANVYVHCGSANDENVAIHVVVLVDLVVAGARIP
jgi:hypothetical protein